MWSKKYFGGIFSPVFGMHGNIVIELITVTR